MSDQPPQYPPPAGQPTPQPGAYPPQGQYPPPAGPGGYPPYSPQPYPQPKKGGARTCLIVGLIVVVLLVVIGGGLLFLLGRRVGTFVSEKIQEPQRISEEFIDAAGRNDIARMRELSDPNSISQSELRDLAEFVNDYCGTIQSKEVVSTNFEGDTGGSTYSVEMKVRCSKQDFNAKLKLRSKSGSSPVVVSGNWETI